MDPYCPQCGALFHESAHFCSRCGSQAQPHPSPTNDGVQAVPPTQSGARPSLVVSGLKGAAWGLAVEFAFAFVSGFLSALSLAAGSHKLAGYEAGLQARHVFQAVGVWPMIFGAAVSVVRAKSGRKGSGSK